jgi:hypothetical protein
MEGKLYSENLCSEAAPSAKNRQKNIYIKNVYTNNNKFEIYKHWAQF